MPNTSTHRGKWPRNRYALRGSVASIRARGRGSAGSIRARGRGRAASTQPRPRAGGNANAAPYQRPGAAPAHPPGAAPAHDPGAAPAHSAPQLPLTDERTVALFGDRRISRAKLFDRHFYRSGGARRRGQRPVRVRWFTPAGQHGTLTSGSGEEWAGPLAVVAHLCQSGQPPDYVLICISSLAVSLSRDREDHETPLSLRPDFQSAFSSLTAGLDNFLSVTSRLLPTACPVVLGVLPEYNQAPETLAVCRRLTAALWQVARRNDAFFVHAEEVVRRRLAQKAAGSGESGEDGAPSGAASAAATAGVSSDEASTTAAAASAPSAGVPLASVSSAVPQSDQLPSWRDHFVTESRLQDIRRDLRQELLHELRHEIRQHKRQAEAGLRVPKAEPEEPAPSSTSLPGGGGGRVEEGDGAGPEQDKAPADVPWVSGWAPGRPPPVDLTAPPLPAEAFEPVGYLPITMDGYKSLKQEVLRLILTE